MWHCRDHLADLSRFPGWGGCWSSSESTGLLYTLGYPDGPLCPCSSSPYLSALVPSGGPGGAVPDGPYPPPGSLCGLPDPYGTQEAGVCSSHRLEHWGWQGTAGEEHLCLVKAPTLGEQTCLWKLEQLLESMRSSGNFVFVSPWQGGQGGISQSCGYLDPLTSDLSEAPSASPPITSFSITNSSVLVAFFVWLIYVFFF